ncbi:MAG TPA: GAF domain-containing sensor histidine kinase [Gemmatimonadaceae bacterium]|nr:GAF domain-containing sensor histidine kinase [Gemmatimonadaceae bacterium]
MSTSSNSERIRTPEEPADVGLRELMAVREVAHAFHTAKRPEEVFQIALDRVSPLIGATFACVFAVGEGEDNMHLAAVHNWPQRYAKFLRQMRVRLGAGPSGQAASERKLIEVPDVFADAGAGDWQEVAMELGFRSIVALPLQAGDTVLGALTFYFASPRAIGPDSRHLMRIVADQMAASAEKARLIQNLEQANAALSTSNAELERQYADLLEARRVKDEFLSNISHELRTPLTAVIGYISLMQEGLAGPMTDEQQNTLDQVKGSSEQLLSLIGDLLQLTALKRGDVEAAFSDVDPRQPLRDAVAATTPRDGVTLDVREPSDVPMMRTDARLVTRTLRALLDNAVKFTREGSVHASLHVDGDRVAYVIEDTGIGIPEDAHRLVFEEFRQVDGSTTREFGGSGLGLALARRLARMLHGDISLTSSPGQGSTFRLELPLRS